MAEWRLGRGWSEPELEKRLDDIRTFDINFPAKGPQGPSGKNWNRYYTEALVGIEAPGEPAAHGAFERAWKAVQNYEFSDPDIVMAHFNPEDPLEDRTMLLELKVLGLRYLCGARVGSIRKVETESEIVRGFRYDTLHGHLEAGSEWFLLTKKKSSGEIWFRIQASWRIGQFPNWWSRVGFEILGRRYQLAWHRLAYLRLREMVGVQGTNFDPVPYGEKLVHTGASVAESDLWVLNQKLAATKVSQLGSPHLVPPAGIAEKETIKKAAPS